MPDLENHAKALAALVAGALAPALLAVALILLGYEPGFSVLGLSAFTGTFTATVVWWVPNRTHGFNVSDIAASLIRAGLESAAEQEDFDHEQDLQSRSPGQGGAQDNPAGRIH